MAGTFTNQTIGGGVVEVDSEEIGYTENDIEFSRTAETKDSLDGIPLQIVGRTIFKEQVSLKIHALEITGSNLSIASLNIPVVTTPGTPVVVSSYVTGTFSTVVPGGLESIKLVGPAHVMALSTMVVKDDATGGTTYVDGTDYVYDPIRARLYRLPAGAITSGEKVRLTYHYTPIASQRINFGVNNPIVNRSILVTHVSPVNAQIITLFIPQCSGQGTVSLAFKKENYWSVELDMIATPSAAYPACPLGYLDVAQAA